MNASLNAACDAVDTWPDWKLDTLRLSYRNKRRQVGEQLPKPTKDQIQLQRECELSDVLAAALKPFMKDNIYDGDNTSTLIGAVRKCRAALAQHAASRSEGTATPK